MLINLRKKEKPNDEDVLIQEDGEIKSIIGFCGSSHYEIIAWFSKALQENGKNVLLVDYSKRNELQNFVMLPETKNGLKRDVPYEYRNTLYLCPSDQFDLDKTQKNYDYVILDFGGSINPTMADKCSVLYWVTDMVLTNVHRLRDEMEFSRYENPTLIIKNYVTGRITPETIISEISYEFNNVFVLEGSIQEQQQLIENQYFDEFRMTALASTTKRFLKEALLDITRDRSILQAIKALEKGRNKDI